MGETKNLLKGSVSKGPAIRPAANSVVMSCSISDVCLYADMWLFDCTAGQSIVAGICKTLYYEISSLYVVSRKQPLLYKTVDW